MTPAFALEAAYSAMIGGLTLEPNAEIADRVSGWWFELVRLLATTDAAHKVDSEAMMASLLLVGVYEAEAARSYVSPAMRTKLLEALRVTQSMADDEERRLTALAWLPAGRAAIGCGDGELAKAISAAIATDVHALRAALFAGQPWDDLEDFRFTGFVDPPLPGILARTLPKVHCQPEIIEKFESLLGDQTSASPRRTGKKSRPPGPKRSPVA